MCLCERGLYDRAERESARGKKRVQRDEESETKRETQRETEGEIVSVSV